MMEVATSEIIWNNDQQKAIEYLTSWRFNSETSRFISLTGPAGTGKTTILQVLRQHFAQATSWSGMTGRAAARMRECADIPAKTLHAVLYHPPKLVDNVAERRIDLIFDEIRNASSNLLVVDEASMIGPQLFADVNSSEYDKVLFVGDAFQIPPILSRADEVNLGPDWSVFQAVSGPRLNQVMRNGGAVLRAATEIRESRHVPTWSAEEDGSYYDFARFRGAADALGHALESWLSDPDDHVLVTWRNKERMVANRALRDYLGHRDPVPQPGEPIIICKNAHRTGLMNGDVVYLESWLDAGPTIELSGYGDVATRFAAVRAEKMSSPSPPGNVADALAWRAAEREGYKTVLVPFTGGRYGSFDGEIPYVGLENLNRAIENAQEGAKRRGVPFSDLTPITYGYCLTAYKVQGSQYRRVTTFLSSDLRNKHFCKLTTLPGGDTVSFALRFLYTAVSRARQHSTLFVSD